MMLEDEHSKYYSFLSHKNYYYSINYGERYYVGEKNSVTIRTAITITDIINSIDNSYTEVNFIIKSMMVMNIVISFLFKHLQHIKVEPKVINVAYYMFKLIKDSTNFVID